MLDASHITNMSQLLHALEIHTADRIFLKYMEDLEVRAVSASRFFALVRQYAAVLAHKELMGKHIAIMGTNRVEWLAGFCAIFYAGGVAVLLSPDWNSQELGERVRQADAEGLLFDDILSETVQGAQFPADFVQLSLDRYSADIRTAPSLPQAAPEALACILFTSGTTAVPKAVMLSHRAVVAGVCHNVIGHSFAAQLAILPFHHVAGFASVLNTWYLDAVACIGRDFKYLYRYLAYMKPDYTLTVPSLLQVILRKLKKGGPNGRNLDWNLHLIGCGGAKFQPDVIQFLNNLNIRVLQSYGATEAGGLGFDWEMTPDCRNTIGKPCPEIDIKIVDGELYLRSASIMMGYYKDPAATAEVLKDGWYATGDLCEQDESGYLYLRGRKKNLIILSNGENVSPEQIEMSLAACEDIDEVMVGVENDLIFATVYPHEDTPEVRFRIEAYLETYNRGVPSYRQVQNLHFSQQPFAKTEIGKMIRRSVTGGNTL